MAGRLLAHVMQEHEAVLSAEEPRIGVLPSQSSRLETTLSVIDYSMPTLFIGLTRSDKPARFLDLDTQPQ